VWGLPKRENTRSPQSSCFPVARCIEINTCWHVTLQISKVKWTLSPVIGRGTSTRLTSTILYHAGYFRWHESNDSIGICTTRRKACSRCRNGVVRNISKWRGERKTTSHDGGWDKRYRKKRKQQIKFGLEGLIRTTGRYVWIKSDIFHRCSHWNAVILALPELCSSKPSISTNVSRNYFFRKVYEPESTNVYLTK
jgi:hypothetical protein